MIWLKLVHVSNSGHISMPVQKIKIKVNIYGVMDDILNF